MNTLGRKNEKGLGIVQTAEFLTVFLVLPTLYAFEAIPLPKLPILGATTGYCLLVLFRGNSFSLRREWNAAALKPALPGILLRGALVAAGSLALVFLLVPNHLFGFPAKRPVLWAVVMVLYPILSALPQEIIYRTFLFRRYGLHLGRFTVPLSALAFGYLHVIYANAAAVILSTVAGYVLGRVYRRSESLAVCVCEHAIYGCIVFTTGLGIYFYSGT